MLIPVFFNRTLGSLVGRIVQLLEDGPWSFSACQWGDLPEKETRIANCASIANDIQSQLTTYTQKPCCLAKAVMINKVRSI